MSSVAYEKIIQEFPSNRTNKTLSLGILPWAMGCGETERSGRFVAQESGGSGGRAGRFLVVKIDIRGEKPDTVKRGFNCTVESNSNWTG